jgi:hypothetical protein
MRHNDAQLGIPETIYKGTKTAIEALTATEGMIAYATDTHEFGSYNGSTWDWGQGVAGQYRQFTYVVTGGDFSFVIDGDGYPVMALQDLE